MSKISKDTLVAIAKSGGDAISGGDANENGAPPEFMRAPDGAALAAGPVKGERDEYRAASYKTMRGNVRTDR